MKLKFGSFCSYGLYSKAFCRIFPVEPFRAHNSSLEGAMKLRFEQKWSSRDALSGATII